MVLEKTLESPLDCKEIQPVHSEGDQSWVCIGRNDAKAETPVLWPSHVKSWSLEKTLMLGGIGGRRWFLDQEDPLEKEMATYSCILAWKIPWTQETGKLQPMGSQRAGHDWANEHSCCSESWANASSSWLYPLSFLLKLHPISFIPHLPRILSQEITSLEIPEFQVVLSQKTA